MEESSEADHPSLLLSQPVPGASSWIRHPELYVLDGNIVLLCENTLFRISGGMLALNSEVFKDMMSLASNQPIDAETYDGCPYIRLTDRAKDLEVFLKALFIAGYIPVDGTLPQFDVMEGMLRLSTKYMAHGLRDRLIHLLSSGYHTLCDEYMVADFDGIEIFGERPHPNRILKLFRECGLIKFLPFAFYQACISMDSIFNAEDGNELCPDDLRVAAVGYMRLLRTEHKAIAKLHKPSPGCKNLKGRRVFVAVAEEPEWAADSILLDRSDFGAQFLDAIRREQCAECCNPCESLAENRRRAFQEDFWYGLPAIFELPGWDELKNEI